MTFDEALDNFTSLPSTARAHKLLKIARRYWLDGMIGDETFDDALRHIQLWLKSALT